MAHHLLNRKICTLLIVALLGMVATAQKPPMPNDTAKHEDSIVVKLVTFYPGDEVFAVYGHTDLRVTQGKHDYYYNYGGDSLYQGIPTNYCYARTVNLACDTYPFFTSFTILPGKEDALYLNIFSTNIIVFPINVPIIYITYTNYTIFLII